MIYDRGIISAISLAALVFSIVILPAHVAGVVTESQSISTPSSATTASKTNERLTFPDDSAALSIKPPVRAERAADGDVTESQAFIPLPSSIWAGLAMLIVMICRKPLLRMVS